MTIMKSISCSNSNLLVSDDLHFETKFHRCFLNIIIFWSRWTCMTFSDENTEIQRDYIMWKISGFLFHSLELVFRVVLFSLLTLNVNIHNMVTILIFLKKFKYSPIECVYVCTHAHARLTKRRKKQSHFGANIIFSCWTNEAQFLVFIPSKFCPCYWAYIFLNQKNIVEVMLCWLGLKAYYLWL